MVSEHVTRACKILRVIAMISGSLVLRAVLIGIINWGMTGKTLAPPFSSISKTPWTATGSSSSTKVSFNYLKFSKKILRFMLLGDHFTHHVLAFLSGVTPLTVANIDSTIPITPMGSESDRALGAPLPSNFHFGGFLDHFWEKVGPKNFHFAE